MVYGLNLKCNENNIKLGCNENNIKLGCNENNENNINLFKIHIIDQTTHIATNKYKFGDIANALDPLMDLPLDLPILELEKIANYLKDAITSADIIQKNCLGAFQLLNCVLQIDNHNHAHVVSINRLNPKIINELNPLDLLPGLNPKKITAINKIILSHFGLEKTIPGFKCFLNEKNVPNYMVGIKYCNIILTPIRWI